MRPYELRIELTDTILQELVWRALAPESIVMMPTFNDALEQQYQQIGPPPQGSRIAGVSVIVEDDGVYAEISYTQGENERSAG